jgi:hypothetical protein
MLTTDTEPPEVTETTVGTDLLETLEVVTHLRVDTVGENLRRLAVDDVLLPVQEPRRDLELRRVLDDGDDTLQLIRVELASTGEGRESSVTASNKNELGHSYRLLRSTSAFLQTRLE